MRKRPRNPWAICTAAVGRKDKAKYERCVMAVKRKMRRNPSISKVWDTLRSAQKYHALRAAGVNKERAEGYATSDWGDLSPDLKGMLLAGWNMATIGGTTRRYSKGDTTRRVPVLANPEDGWRVTHDGETLKVFGKKDDDAGAGAAFRYLQQRQSQSVDWAIRHEGYDIVKVEGGKVVFSRRREIDERGKSKRNPIAKPFEVEGSHSYVASMKGGGWRIYETYKTYADALDWAKFIMKQGIPGVRGNVQALILRPTGQRTYSVFWRSVRRVASNPVPIWMQSDEMFHKVVGVSIKEWQRIFRALPEWKKKEFHRRAGKKILSANAMKWVVAQGLPASLPNKAKLSRDGSFKCVVCGAKLYPDGQDVDCACGASYNAFGQRLRPRSQWAEGSDYNKRRRRPRRSRKNYIHKGRVWYVGLYKTSRGLLWDAKETMQSLKKGIVGKILKISAPSSTKAIQEAWRHRRRLGL